jgi:hypothetical protein
MTDSLKDAEATLVRADKKDVTLYLHVVNIAQEAIHKIAVCSVNHR